VLNWLRNESKRESKILSFVSLLIEPLNDRQQTELYAILHDLPPAVMGDEVAREELRVFIDVGQDVRSAQRIEADKVAHKSKLIDVITGVIVELIQMPGWENISVVGCLLQLLEEDQRLRFVLEQVMLARWIPPDRAKRQELLETMFRRENVVES